MSSISQDPSGRRRGADRRFIRLATSLPGILAGRTEHPIEVIDLSLGGCLVRSAACPEPGAIVDLRFSLGAEAFRATSRVREASIDGAAGEGMEAPRYLVGLEFLRLSASDQDLLRQFLASESRRRRGGSRLTP
jgi:c-di-GMP-binding flagellar brake protein YcgR